MARRTYLACCLECEQGGVLFLNDGDQYLHLELMEPEEVGHLLL
jgi:hypothetical protein